MSTIVCQNLVSCFTETTTTTTTTTLKLRVAHEIKNTNSTEFENWNFIQTAPKESPYNNTNKKQSISSLSAESLDLCTENLGSESGSSDIITTDNDNASLFSSPNSISQSHSKSNQRRKSGVEIKNNYPPPLTTMSGSSSLQVRRHSEGGRLIIEATSFRNPYLQAERSDGRLRLCFFTEDDDDDDDDGIEEEIKSEEESESESESELELEMEMEKFQRISSRCHRNEGLCTSSNWKPALCVASS